MTTLEEDVQRARSWLAEVGMMVVREAETRNETVGRLVDLSIVIGVCANLPGDMPLRVRLFPDVFKLEGIDQ